MLRTHTCGELSLKEKGKEVQLAGWVHARRDHGGVIFIDLRDRYGLTQIKFNPGEIFSVAEKLRREDVIAVTGKVAARGKDLENPNLATGKIEVEVSSMNVLNKSETPPIEVDDRIEAGEDLRLRYRYLDLRRPLMQKRLRIRHEAAAATREFLNKQHFIEIETPLLIRATPEGARDYIVPSRVNPGKFYSLPQSPQLYKQILMVSGMDRYYQLAKCLRDEDLRQDRQPEFTQIDIEMSFIEEEDLYTLCEGMIKHIWKKAINVEVKTPFQRFTYEEAMGTYGSDKPDIRFGLELIDVSAVIKASDFEVFKHAEQVKCINPSAEIPRKELDKYIDFCQNNGAKGMAWMRVTDKGLDGSIVKFFNEDAQKKLLDATQAKKGSTLLFIADKPKAVAEILGKLRLRLGKDLKLFKEEEFTFLLGNSFSFIPVG